MQHVRTGRAWLGEAPSPCSPGSPGCPRLLLFYPGENAGANPAGSQKSLWFMQPRSPMLWWRVQSGNPRGGTVFPAASMGAALDAGGSNTQ